MTSRLFSRASVRTPRRAASVLALLLAVVGTLFSVGAANACACGGPPSAPQNVVATQSGAGAVTVTWEPPADDGGNDIVGYIVGWDTPTSDDVETVGSDIRSHAFTGLKAGSYTFWVEAENTVVEGPRGEASLTVSGSAPTLAVSHRIRTAGSKVVLSGIWEAGRKVTLERAVAGGSWSSIGTVTVDSTKHYSRTLEPVRTARYRTRSTTHVLSATHKVTVRARVTLSAHRAGVRTYRLSGKVYPAVKGRTLRLYVARHGGYKKLKAVHTTKTGYFRYHHEYGATRTYTIKAVSAATSHNAKGRRVLEVAVH